jgi:hypothetical protein
MVCQAVFNNGMHSLHCLLTWGQVCPHDHE